MSVINYINASLEIWGCIMSIIVAVCLIVSKRPHNLCDRLYLRMLAFNAGSLLFDVMALFFRGHPGWVCWWGVRISNLIAFSCGYLLFATFAHYLTVSLGRNTKVSSRPLAVCRILCAISLLLVVLTQFFPLVYTIDAQNVYHRASLFWVSHVTGLIGMALCAWMLVRYRSAIETQERTALWLYILLPILAMGVQIFVYGLALLNLVNTFSLVVIFLFLQAEQGRRMAEQESKLTESRIAIMLSQIQPHFLYNSLNSIYYLCEKDPAQAQAAIDDFATYLRGNLDSLKRTAPVSFERELEHVRIYLSLEKMRFDDDLMIAYDIQTTEFLIPALTVQPLVENAVKYGVGKKVSGGTLDMQSTKDVGTIATIRLPKDNR